MRAGLHRFAGIALALSASTVARAEDASWTRASAPSRLFSVETPCTLLELERFKALPADVIAGSNLPAEMRVACSKDSVVLVAALVEVDAAETGNTTFFDALMDKAKSDTTAEGVPSRTVIDGRRAFLNRQVEGDVVAQTGFVEAGRNRIVLIITGMRPDSGLSITEQGQIIDRFCNSIKVSGA